MNKNKIKVSVIGSCVCRDFFEFGQTDFEVNTDIRFSSPISMIQKPLTGVCADFTDFKKKAQELDGNWYKKTLINDINKTAFSKLKERHGEYVVIDMCEARMNIAKVTNKENNESTLMTYSSMFRRQYNANLKYNVFKNCNIESFSPLFFDNLFWENTLKVYFNNVLEIFDEDKIILIQNMPAVEYRDVSGGLAPFRTPFHINEIQISNILLPSLYGIARKICPKAKIINIPPKFVGDQNHKWKTYPYHFTKSYYDYLLNCVQSITGLCDASLDFLYKKYEAIFAEEYTNAQLRSVKLYNSEAENCSDYLNIIESIEEFHFLGRRKKALILFACDRHNYLKNIKKLKK